MTKVVAEEPSVARDIAHILCDRSRRDGYLLGNRNIVTWTVGLLVTLPEPKDVHDHWRRRSRDLEVPCLLKNSILIWIQSSAC